MKGKTPNRYVPPTSYALPAIKQLPFRAAFHAKLQLIVAEYGNYERAAAKLKIGHSVIIRWLDGQRGFCGPGTKRLADVVDEHYYICWERREIRAGHKRRNKRSRAEQEAQEKAARRAGEALWQTEAMHEAITGESGLGNFFEPAKLLDARSEPLVSKENA